MRKLVTLTTILLLLALSALAVAPTFTFFSLEQPLLVSSGSQFFLANPYTVHLSAIITPVPQIIEEELVIAPEKEQSPAQEIEIPTHHTVELGDKGFNPKQIEIKVADTVEWKNIRTNKLLKKAMIISSPVCGHFKSPIYSPGESFSQTFEKANTCVIVDAISKHAQKIIIEE